MYVLKPPTLLVKLGHADASEAWIAEKAMYGLRQSPRSWSIYRDKDWRLRRSPLPRPLQSQSFGY